MPDRRHPLHNWITAPPRRPVQPVGVRRGTNPVYAITVSPSDIAACRRSWPPPQPPFPPAGYRMLDPGLGPLHFSVYRQYGEWLWQDNSGSMIVGLEVELDTHHEPAAQWLRDFGAGADVPPVTFLFERF